MASRRRTSPAAPACEDCGKHPAVSLSAFRAVDGDGKDTWRLTCDCTSERESYYVRLEDYFAEPEDWLNHLSEKTWFDRASFLAAVGRLLRRRLERAR